MPKWVWYAAIAVGGYFLYKQFFAPKADFPAFAPPPAEPTGPTYFPTPFAAPVDTAGAYVPTGRPVPLTAAAPLLRPLTSSRFAGGLGYL